MTNDEKKGIELIAEGAALLGWTITFDGTSEDVNYIIVGKPEILDNLIEKIEK